MEDVFGIIEVFIRYVVHRIFFKYKMVGSENLKDSLIQIPVGRIEVGSKTFIDPK